MAKQYLNVAYKDKDLVKSLGGRWDASVKRWYCPRGSELARIYAWRAPQVKMVERAEVHLIAAMEARRKSPQSDNLSPAITSKEPSQLSLLG